MTTTNVSSIASASHIQMDYMKLLITQLQNQNPLEPMNNQEMSSQLAQFSQLSQLESVNSKLDQANENFGNILYDVQRTYADSLIGKKVSYYKENEDGEIAMTSGIVDKTAYDNVNKDYLLLVGQDAVEVNDIVLVENQAL
ncbi:MAG: hypothetical protein KAS23_15055 [Anaerohalosphaera sp.]|nr:hypothetical protein [Anaerohalosphaera sp.]